MDLESDTLPPDKRYNLENKLDNYMIGKCESS